MKKVSMMILSVALMVSASASAATYTCTGTQDTQGTVRVFMNNSGMAVFGGYVDNDTKKTIPVQCESHTGKIRGQFLYAQTQKSGNCPIDYVRIPSYINDPKGGIIAIVDRTGADNQIILATRTSTFTANSKSHLLNAPVAGLEADTGTF